MSARTYTIGRGHAERGEVRRACRVFADTPAAALAEAQERWAREEALAQIAIDAEMRRRRMAAELRERSEG